MIFRNNSSQYSEIYIINNTTRNIQHNLYTISVFLILKRPFLIEKFAYEILKVSSEKIFPLEYI